MRAVIQRVKFAKLSVNGEKVSEIGAGLLTLLGVGVGDTMEQAEKLIQKICDLRIFEDENEKMNLSLKDIKGEHLIVSQFTLLADTKKGNRPSFVNAEKPEIAKAVYEHALRYSESLSIPTKSGKFGHSMQIELLNSGPVTIVMEI